MDRCESCLSIDLAWMRRHGHLAPGASGALTWSSGGRQTGAVGFQTERHGLRLIYSTRQDEGPWTQVDDRIPFVTTPMRFGGHRIWFCCPGCQRRCRVIYGGNRFLCRNCHGLRYNSQYEPSYQRQLDMADKLRKRVGGDRGAFDELPFPPKPKWMRWPTYHRLEAKYDRLNDLWTVGVMEAFGVR
ncbi:MAG: hypothetical protein AB7S74_01905 [Hyphomicrobium sp.]